MSDQIQDLFDTAYSLREEQQEINERKNHVRIALRSLNGSGVLTNEQSDEVEELFPTVTRPRKNKTTEGE